MGCSASTNVSSRQVQCEGSKIPTANNHTREETSERHEQNGDEAKFKDSDDVVVDSKSRFNIYSKSEPYCKEENTANNFIKSDTDIEPHSKTFDNSTVQSQRIYSDNNKNLSRKNDFVSENKHADSKSDEGIRASQNDIIENICSNYNADKSNSSIHESDHANYSNVNIHTDNENNFEQDNNNTSDIYSISDGENEDRPNSDNAAGICSTTESDTLIKSYQEEKYKVEKDTHNKPDDTSDTQNDSHVDNDVKTNSVNSNFTSIDNSTISDAEIENNEDSNDESKTDNWNQYKDIDYTAVDDHARKAPSSLRNSSKDLVEYLQQISKEPIMLARAIFVWITDNIRYDIDGYFGAAPRAPTAAKNVMKCGKSVCQGYANVMELLCREANIHVKLLSGFAKGYGHSADQTITTKDRTDHAWNAVQLDGKWYLIDCTWAAGHVRGSSFCKSFQPFYFLTKPEQFISSHFPYMNNDMTESMKWQLLEQPITLNAFSKSLKLNPNAFELSLSPLSHTLGDVTIKIDEQFVFRNVGNFEVGISTRLEHLEGNYLVSQPNSVFVEQDGKLFNVKVHPNKTGTFHLSIFGQKKSDIGLYNQLFTYILKCTQIDDEEFEYPMQYSIEDRLELIKPTQYKLKANTEVEFHLTSLYLLRIMIGNTIWIKENNTFKGTFETGYPGEMVTIYGSKEPTGSLTSLYKFKIV